jgi:hypothetical protein
MPEIERRRLERLDLRVPALVQPSTTPGANRATNCFLLTRDISSQGAYFQTLEPDAYEGQVQIKLILKVPTCTKQMKYMCLTMAGEVLRRDAAGLAVRFEDDYTLRTLL